MFNAILHRIVEETPGGIGAVLMGYDGISIEQYFRPDAGLDLNLVAVEYANILKEIKKAAEILHLGHMEEVSIRTERFYLLVRMLTDDYFVALTLQGDGNFGKGRYLLLREAGDFREALA
ncbi:MAG: roadblock/LC7 domain-containing protein [Trichloromonas sp.]|jgi:predicted regulator of Ras-like GTPase activity (Roadblock/LC7/MglB family)|nr:roadblock/LC7 domain-containing protein [Trichloromonas sp.]